MLAEIEIIELPTNTADEIDHAFCKPCYDEGARQGLCGTPMPPDARITDPDAPDGDCVVCFAYPVTCNLCGAVFTHG